MIVNFATQPLDALFDAGFASLAGKVAGVFCGNTRQRLLTDDEVTAYRTHVAPNTTGTRLWTDPSHGTYVIDAE